MNPMGKDHVPTLLDTLIAFDAETVAARAVGEATVHVANIPGEFKIGLAVSDDLKGGWTNRYASEFRLCFEMKPILKRGWLSAILWTSETPSIQTTRETVLTTIYRAAYIQQHGLARTLREMLAQESYALALAGCTQPALDSDDLAYTREIITPHLDAKDRPTVMTCLFGDVAAPALGYPPQGLSPRAGLALALHARCGSTFMLSLLLQEPRSCRVCNSILTNLWPIPIKSSGRNIMRHSIARFTSATS